MVIFGKGILSWPTALRTGRVLVLQEFLAAVPRFARWGNGRDSSTSACGTIFNPTPVVEYMSSRFLGAQHVWRWYWALVSGGCFRDVCPWNTGSVLTAVVEPYNIVVYVPSVLELTDITVMMDTRLCKTFAAEI